MGSRVRIPLLQGFGVPHAAALDGQRLATALASYSESGGVPGLAVPDRPAARLLPRVHHAQDKAVELTVQRSGMPGSTLHATVSVDGSDPMGWSPPDQLQFARGLGWPGVSATSWDVVALDGSAYLVAVLADGANVRVLRFDGSAWTVLVESQAMEHAEHVALVELHGARLLLGCCDATGATLYYSDDVGETWQLYVADAWPQPPADPPAHVDLARMGDALLWVVGDDADVLWQYASGDLGSTWTLVDSRDDMGRDVACFALPGDAGIGITYTDAVSLMPHYARLASPWHAATGITPTRIEVFALAGSLVGLQDPSGVLYVLAGVEGAMWRSTDGGATWQRSASRWWNSGGINGSPLGLRGCAYAGGVALLSTPANVGVTRQVTHHQVGGWSSVVPAGGWTAGRTWAGWRALTAEGWSLAGTPDVTDEPDGSVTLTSAGASGYYHRTPAAGTDLGLLVELEVPSSADAFRGIRVYRSLVPTSVYTINIHASTDGYTVAQASGGSGPLATVSADMSQPMQLLISLEAGRLRVWQRRPSIRSTWELVCDGVITPVSFATANSIRLGLFSAAAGALRTRLLCWSETALDVDELPGAFLTAAPLALPHAASGVGMSYISAVGGPGVQGEVYTIAPRFEHALEHALLGVPSPYEVWRAADTAEQLITWDLGDTEWIGAAYFLVLDRCNFRTAFLEGSVDGESWDVLATYDGATGFDGLGLMQSGHHLVPTGATSGARYIQPGELVGGHVEYGDATCDTIEACSGGHWTIQATERVRLRMATSRTITAGAAAVVAPGGLAVGYPVAEKAYRYVRVRIPSQPCPDPAFEAGVITWGRLDVLGQESSWGWSQRGAPNFASSRNDWGTEHRRRRGPVGREWAVNWTDGAGVGRFRSDPSADYVAVGDGYPPLVALGNVWWRLTGLLAETDYVRPVVWCNSLPATSTTITDRTRWILGHLSGDVQIDGNLGTEGIDEHGRISNLTISELR